MKLSKGSGLQMAVLVLYMLSGAVQAASLTGMVRKAGKGVPISGATVLVYSAQPRKGHGTVCPTCYPDTGKRVTTDPGGNFSIGGLDNQLVFDLLFIADGFRPSWFVGVDLLQIDGPVEFQLGDLPAADLAGTVVGRIVDARGEAVPYALVLLVGLDFGGDRPVMGNFPDGVAVSNEDGLFELRSAVSRALGGVLPKSLILEVLPQGMAPALHKVAIGSARQDLRVTPGATVAGRVVAQGKPVSRATLMLLTSAQDADERYEPIYIDTDKEGRFAITHVPAGREWSLDANLDSGMGSLAALSVKSPADGETVDLGDVEIRKGSSLSGRVVLGDGKVLPMGLRVTITSNAGGSRNAVLDQDGKFEFEGLSGEYQLVPPDVPGYRRPQGAAQQVRVDKNVKGLKIMLEPGP